MKAVNLIPAEQRTTAKPLAGKGQAPVEDRPVGAFAVLGVLAFAVIAMALLVMAGNSVSQNKADLAAAQQELRTTESQAQALQSFAEFKSLSDARSATVKGLAAARFPWRQAFDDISRALPDDVYVKSVDGTTSTLTAGGSGIRGAIAAPAIEIIGCTRDQASVARLMGQLRGVRGATRVSLVKSAKPEDGNSNTGITPSPLTGTASESSTVTEPCPKKSPPEFDVVVFFERAPLSPNAAPNAGAAGIVGPTGPTGPTGAAGTQTTTPASTTSTP